MFRHLPTVAQDMAENRITIARTGPISDSSRLIEDASVVIAHQSLVQLLCPGGLARVMCQSTEQKRYRGGDRLAVDDHCGLWHTASRLCPSGSITNAP